LLRTVRAKPCLYNDNIDHKDYDDVDDDDEDNDDVKKDFIKAQAVATCTWHLGRQHTRRILRGF